MTRERAIEILTDLRNRWEVLDTEEMDALDFVLANWRSLPDAATSF